jgi:FlaA1/EpsC-like NDP-sugar epimerase
LRLETEYYRIQNKTVVADIRNKEAMDRVLDSINPVVFHAAAYKHVPLMEENPSQAIYTNIGGTKNLADLSCLYNVKKCNDIYGQAVNLVMLWGSKRIAVCAIFR